MNRPPARPSRSALVTVLGWCVVAASTLGCIASIFTLLMLVAGSPGTRNATLSGGLMVIGLPPLTLLAGIGLLCRWRWAHAYVLVLLGALAAGSVARMVRGSTPQYTYTSPGGVPTTVLASHVNYAGHFLLIGISAGLIAILSRRAVRAEFWPARPTSSPVAIIPKSPISPVPASPSTSVPVQIAPARRELPQADAGHEPQPGRDWRTGHQGRDDIFYEERSGAGWQRIRISGEMLMGRAHHAIYFPSPRDWLEYPEWAQNRRDEIIARIKSALHAPDYEYEEDRTRGVAPSFASRAAIPRHAPSLPLRRSAIPRSQSRAMIAIVAFLVAVAGYMSWLVVQGVAKGETRLPARFTSSRNVVRAEAPALYWASIGVYALVGAGTLGLGGWAACAAYRLRP